MASPDPFRLDLPPLRHSRQRQRTMEAISGGPEPVSLSTVNTHHTMPWVFAVIGMSLIFLIGRLAQLQVAHGQTYRLRADHNRLRTMTTPAPRGLIVDRFGRPLADNSANIVVTLTPADLPKGATEREAMLASIADALHQPLDTIRAALSATQRRSTDPVSIIDHLSAADAIADLVATANMPAVSIVSVPNRSYPLNAAAAALLGYTGRISPDELKKRPDADPLDIVGKTGLERSYNTQLTGRDGVREVERDVRNREQRVISQRDPVPGNTVVTTIDRDLQTTVASRLQAMVTSAHSPGGAAIAMDPNTGEVLAMASAPTFDDNWFVSSGHAAEISASLTSPTKPLLNRAISGQYPSGSIVKPIISVAALAEHVITPTTTVLSVGGFKVGDSFFPDWKSGGHGLTNVTKAIAESVNTFFYAVGGGYQDIVGLGVDRIVNYLQRFGWGKPTGIDLPAEASGFLPTKEWRTSKRPSPWRLGDTYHLSIGQGDLEVTPIQVAAGISAVANGGTLWQPHVVSAITTAEGQTVESIKPHASADRLSSTDVLSVVQGGMRAGVLSGSSRSLQSLPVTSAGKTGTAQFGNEGKTHSWYAAYAPYDHPKIVIVVIVEAGGEGNSAALPVAKDVLQWYFTDGAGKS